MGLGPTVIDIGVRQITPQNSVTFPFDVTCQTRIISVASFLFVFPSTLTKLIKRHRDERRSIGCSARANNRSVAQRETQDRGDSPSYLSACSASFAR